ncbi:rod shape-determining protein MreC [Variovorax sp. PCZ-1]|uniref:rod shape-determining protein MreC n=1 Tax=Variovorax sp. PCZ-1 TaxID=2835533 RepID=UPI001BCDA044|nr:rod shape-determining protein MreC [Variovorax sp. PCZ-1]
MPLGTLDRTPPPFFKQGQSALSKLMLFSALALFLMVADTRFKLTGPIRVAVATALYPVQWAVMRPIEMARGGGAYFVSLDDAQKAKTEAEKRLALQAQRAAQVEQLGLENDRLRKLLALKERTTTPAQAAQVVYDAADPFTRRVMVDKGSIAGIKGGSPVMDESGVLGQVTRVYPLSSEVTLLIDRDHTIPVLNTRTGARSVVYGDPSIHGGTLELRFMAGNADVQQGDILTTSGVDGVYPPGMPVAKVDKVERRADSAFAKIICQPLANTLGARHVMILEPFSVQIPIPASVESAQSAPKKGAKK